MSKSSPGQRNSSKKLPLTLGKAESLVQEAGRAGRTSLFEFEAGLVARHYGIPVADYGLADSESQAVHLAKTIGWPVAMKIVSAEILHKSDVDGVRVDINSPAELRKAYREIIENVKRAKKNANVHGVLVQKMAQKGYEFVVGGHRDPQFGPTVMFGVGGLYVELYKDVAFRLAPVSEDEALVMMKEIKGAPILTGFRGSKPLDVQATAKAIVAVGKMMVDFEEIDSIDINPLLIYPRGILAIDVRVILRKQGTRSEAQSKREL